MSKVRLGSTSFLMPGNRVWAGLSRMRELAFCDYGAWSSALLESKEDDDVAVVLFLDDVMTPQAVSLEESIKVFESFFGLLKNRLENSSGLTIVAFSSCDYGNLIRHSRVIDPVDQVHQWFMSQLASLCKDYSSLYKIDLNKEGILSEDLDKISRLIIPIEDNYIFSIPVLILNIPELDCHTYMRQIELIKNNKKSVGIYEPLDDIEFKKDNINKITIDIRDITGTKFESNDILKINIVEILENVIIFTCSNIDPNNFKVNDSIKIINNYTEELINLMRQPFSIERIIDNTLYCKLPFNSCNNIYNNIDMKILNISNQNVLFFN